MLYLGINAGYGNSDCSRLPRKVLQDAIDSGWINYPRPKTAVERRCPLWPETIQAIQEAGAKRPSPKDPTHNRLAFLTRRGQPWSKEIADSPVSKEFRKLLDSLGLYRPGLSFYALRHCFETIAGECGDQVAVSAIMGHVDNSMAGAYRERISDERLQRASATVRLWLFRRGSADLWRSRRPRRPIAP
jgi:integrase